MFCPNNIPSLEDDSKTSDFIHKDFRTRASIFLASVKNRDRIITHGSVPS